MCECFLNFPELSPVNSYKASQKQSIKWIITIYFVKSYNDRLLAVVTSERTPESFANPPPPSRHCERSVTIHRMNHSRNSNKITIITNVN